MTASDSECHNEWQRVTMNDKEWQPMTASNKKWQWMRANRSERQNEWKRMRVSKTEDFMFQNETKNQSGSWIILFNFL